jgi:hypothetical protein
MLTDEVDYVVGVDTHLDQHVLAVVASPTGAIVAQRSVGASRRGYAQALRFANQHASGRRVWAVEGAGHYGAGLARYLSGRGETVLEAGRSPRGERRLRGKDDGLDATHAARAALRNDELALPRAGPRHSTSADAYGRSPWRRAVLRSNEADLGPASAERHVLSRPRKSASGHGHLGRARTSHGRALAR